MNTRLRLAALMIAGVSLLGCESGERKLTLAVTAEEPAPSIAETVRTTLGARGFELSIEATADPREVLESIARQTLDLAIIEEPDQPIAGLQTIAPLYPSVLHVLYAEDQASNDFAELISGASIYAGPPGGASYRLLMKLADEFGVPNSQLNILDNPWTVRPDVFFVFGGLLSKDSISQLRGYQLYSFASESDAPGSSVADAIALKHHHLRPFVFPRGIYHSLAKRSVVSLSIRTVLVAHESFDEDLAFDVSAALFRNAQDVARSYPLVTRELTEGLDAVQFMLPIHAGTRRYLDRDGPGFVERYVDVLALYLSIALALVSAAIAYYRYRRQVRKDRVDVYYAGLIQIRNRISEDHPEQFAVRKAEVLALQGEVLDLLIEERIAADASLIAFVSLSNQMLAELSPNSH